MTAPAPTASLSPREIEVLEHVAQGLTYATVARRLQISPHTVETYLRRIRAKTGSTNRTQLVLIAFALRQHPSAGPAVSARPGHAPGVPSTQQEPPLRRNVPDRGKYSPTHHREAPGHSGDRVPAAPPQHHAATVRAGAPDPAAATTPAEFVTKLRLLKAWSGEPSLRRLEKQTGLPRSTLAQALDSRRNRLPPLERVVTIVLACGVPAGTADYWADSWRRIQILHCHSTPAQFPVTPTGAATTFHAGREA